MSKIMNNFTYGWRQFGHVYENYSALTGHGKPTDDKAVCSCPFYTWGALFSLIALANVE